MSEKYYRFSAYLMGVLSFICLLLTLFYQFTGDNVFSGTITPILLFLFAALTTVCLCLMSSSAKGVYRAGYYLLHGGLVVLLAGFMINHLTGVSYNISFDKDGLFYDSVKDGDKIVSLGFGARLDGCRTDYYDEPDSNGQPLVKQYYSEITFLDENGNTNNETLSVNHPIYRNGFKIYLMSISSDGNSASFIFKKEPAEYTVYAGIILLIAGTFMMCFSGNGIKREEGNV